MKFYLKNIIVFISILFSGDVFGQKGFYLSPILDHKWYTNNNRSCDIITQQGNVVNIYPINSHTDGFGFGLNAGYQTKNLFFECGLALDHANLGFIIRSTDFHPIGHYSGIADYAEYSGKYFFARIPVRAGIKLFGKDSVFINKKLRWQGFLYGGGDYLLFGRGSGAIGNTYFFYTDSVNYIMAESFGYSGSLSIREPFIYLQQLALRSKHMIKGEEI